MWKHSWKRRFKSWLLEVVEVSSIYHLFNRHFLEQYVVELSSLPYFWGNIVHPCSFPIFNFSKNRVEFFLRRHQLYGHLPPITKTIQVRRTRHAGHCWRSKDELISDVLLWTPAYGQAKAGRPARTYIQQLCEDTGCSPEDLPEAMNDREKWWQRVRDIRASGTTWWWWWWFSKSL